MPGRAFKLPNIQDLSKEQEAVRALPLEGQHLIVGGPGTGKSVVALLRARRLAAEGRDYSFLVFNHLLHRASLQLYRGPVQEPNQDLKCATWNAWLSKEFEAITDEDLPRLDPRTSGGWQPVDWDSAMRIAEGASNSEKQAASSRFLVIDEGQDMPPKFYRIVIELGFENLFVVADQNQQITEENSSIQDIADELALDESKVRKLHRNFRNKYSVARLARAFFTRDPASPPPKFPELQPEHSRIDLPIYYPYDAESLPDIAHRILKKYERNPQHLVGIIAPNNKSRMRFVDAIRAADENTQSGANRPRITTFSTIDRPNVRFDKGGILVINVQACKGLEFDVVFCADIDDYYFNFEHLDILRKQFYVMVARAREQVILLARRDGDRRIEENILPHDRQVLRWH